jgi:glutathione synthase/RimK-type ligase-like ATP-grasp enzyme
MGKIRRFEEEEAAIHAAGISYFDDREIAAMRRIQRALGLDYMGIDFGITGQDELLLFEANATMNFFPFTNRDQSHYSWQCLPKAIEAMRLLVANRLQEANQSSNHTT